MTTGAVIFFGVEGLSEEACDISNFLIIPRGANLLSFSTTITFSSSSCFVLFFLKLFVIYEPCRSTPQSPPPFNLTPTSHQSESLLYLLLRYRPVPSPLDTAICGWKHSHTRVIRKSFPLLSTHLS